MNLLKLTEITALFCTGLLAGVFFAFETAVNPALHRLPDMGYLTAMQHINRLIQNPAFLLIFIAPVMLLPLLAWQQGGKIPGSVSGLAAAVIYVGAVFSVTIFCNVPLNETLDKFDLSGASQTHLQAIRERYELPWNRWHTLRTWAALVAFLLAALPLLLPPSNSIQTR